jgi:septal ring factor EnvC (AmiA/AmiB activator)
MSVIVGEPVTPDAHGEWRSIQDAARHLSVSERTVYRRADRRQLRRRTLSDGRVEVFVPMTVPTDVSDIPSDIDSQERAVTLVDRVSAAVSRQLESLTVELSASRERIEALARENGTLSERLLGLQRELTDVRQMADIDRQRLTAERDALLTAQAKQEAQPELASMAATHNTRKIRLASLWRLWPAVLTLVVALLLAVLLGWPV